MKLKEEDTFFVFLKKTRAILKKTIKIFKIPSFFIIISIIFIVGLLSGMLLTGFFGTLNSPSPLTLEIFHELGINDLRELRSSVKGILNQNIRLPVNFIKGKFSYPDKLYLDIDFINYQKLRYLREQALDQGVLIKTGDDYIPAKMTYEGQEIDIKLRLKGDLVDHLDGEKWSFRIKTKGGNLYKGMKTFSLQDPKTRYNINEFVFHEALKNENIISLRYSFVEVIINGDNKGIYALEEHFEKQLIESNDRREGVVLKFDEDFGWENYIRTFNATFDQDMGSSNITNKKSFYIMPIDTFDNDAIINDETLSKQFNQAKNLLESFRAGELSVDEVFDIKILAKYYAITTIFGAIHGSGEGNIRFYYNPVTSKLEPIGFDALPFYQQPSDVLNAYLSDDKLYSSEFFNILFSDEKFVVQYIQELNRISDKSYLDNLFKILDPKIEEYTNIIHKDKIWYYFPRDDFYSGQSQIRSRLNPVQGINAHVNHINNENISINIGNADVFPFEIRHIIYNDTVILPLIGEKNILKSQKDGPVNYTEFTFYIPQNRHINMTNLKQRLKIVYIIQGLNRTFNRTIYPWNSLDYNFNETNILNKKINMTGNNVFKTNEDRKEIVFNRGLLNIEENIIFPSGYTVIALPGTTIDLVKNSSIISYSKIKLEGREDDPIKIMSSDNTGEGIAIIQANDESILNHIIFSNLTNPTKYDWELTGAITFYKSPVTLKNIKLELGNTEDNINFINSPFKIENLEFRNCYSDCIDSDFSDGIINNSYFISCGNDCVDFSGAKAELYNILIEGVGDKGVSAGEESEIYVENVTINPIEAIGNIGFASKDSSKLTINKSILNNLNYGFAVYQKKSEYGAASIVANNIIILNVEESYIVEKESGLTLNDAIIINKNDKVYKSLYN